MYHAQKGNLSVLSIDYRISLFVLKKKALSMNFTGMMKAKVSLILQFSGV